MAGIKETSARKIHRSASRTAKKKGFGKERARRYVYGAKRKAGWKPGKRK